MDADAIAVIVSALVAGVVGFIGSFWTRKGKTEDAVVEERRVEIEGLQTLVDSLLKRVESLEHRQATTEDELRAERDYSRVLVDHIYKQLPPPPPKRTK